MYKENIEMMDHILSDMEEMDFSKTAKMKYFAVVFDAVICERQNTNLTVKNVF